MAILEEFFPLRRHAIEPGPDRLECLMRAPEGRAALAQPCILIVGTNGKGTTSLLLESVLRRGSIKTGTYTSPHFINPLERIRIGGRQVSESTAAEARETVLRWRDQNLPDASFFEITTAIALLCFKACGCELLIIEAGLGGRLDSTNALAPLMTILTSVGLDHVDRLGGTQSAIAFEKAMASRRHRTLLTGFLGAEAREGVMKAVALTGACWVDGAAPSAPQINGVASSEEEDPLPPRQRNATTVTAALPYLEKALRNKGLQGIADRLQRVRDDLRRSCGHLGLAHEVKPPRATWLEALPLPGRCDMRVFCGQLIILDTAHNPAAARALLSQLNWHLGRSRAGASLRSPSFDLVFGSLLDKDYAATFALLASQSGGGIILTFSHEQSLTTVDASQLAAKAPSGVGFELGTLSGLRSWIMRRRATGRLHRPLVVTGSFALIGQVMEELRFDPL